jgi:hypothetical protein
MISPSSVTRPSDSGASLRAGRGGPWHSLGAHGRRLAPARAAPPLLLLHHAPAAAPVPHQSASSCSSSPSSPVGAHVLQRHPVARLVLEDHQPHAQQLQRLQGGGASVGLERVKCSVHAGAAAARRSWRRGLAARLWRPRAPHRRPSARPTTPSPQPKNLRPVGLEMVLHREGPPLAMPVKRLRRLLGRGLGRGRRRVGGRGRRGRRVDCVCGEGRRGPHGASAAGGGGAPPAHGRCWSRAAPLPPADWPPPRTPSRRCAPAAARGRRGAGGGGALRVAATARRAAGRTARGAAPSGREGSAVAPAGRAARGVGFTRERSAMMGKCRARGLFRGLRTTRSLRKWLPVLHMGRPGTGGRVWRHAHGCVMPPDLGGPLSRCLDSAARNWRAPHYFTTLSGPAPHRQMHSLLQSAPRALPARLQARTAAHCARQLPMSAAPAARAGGGAPAGAAVAAAAAAAAPPGHADAAGPSSSAASAAAPGPSSSGSAARAAAAAAAPAPLYGRPPRRLARTLCASVGPGARPGGAAVKAPPRQQAGGAKAGGGAAEPDGPWLIVGLGARRGWPGVRLTPAPVPLQWHGRAPRTSHPPPCLHLQATRGRGTSGRGTT